MKHNDAQSFYIGEFIPESDSAAQTDLSFALHDWACHVPHSGHELVSAGLCMLERQTLAEHALCRQSVQAMLQVEDDIVSGPTNLSALYVDMTPADFDVTHDMARQECEYVARLLDDFRVAASASFLQTGAAHSDCEASFAKASLSPVAPANRVTEVVQLVKGLRAADSGIEREWAQHCAANDGTRDPARHSFISLCAFGERANALLRSRQKLDVPLLATTSRLETLAKQLWAQEYERSGRGASF
jgi:hypothetical protein